MVKNIKNEVSKKLSKKIGCGQKEYYGHFDNVSIVYGARNFY